LKEFIAKYSTRDAFLIASVYALRNQRDEAFEGLDRAYAQREGNVVSTNLEPMLKNLHGDTRFAAFLKKLNLPASSTLDRVLGRIKRLKAYGVWQPRIDASTRT
jgi:hypothetical protein